MSLDDDDSLCPYCAGSGEGMHDGSTCHHCKGRGVEGGTMSASSLRDDDDYADFRRDEDR